MKKVGKVVLIVIGVLVVLGGLSSACTGRSSSAGSTDAIPAASSSSAVSDQALQSGDVDAKAVFEGTWDAVKLTLGDTTYGEKELQASRAGGVDSYIVFNDDGTGALVMADAVLDFTWKAKDQTHVVFAVDDSYVTLTLSDGRLSESSGKTVFVKGEPRASLPVHSDDSSTGASSSSDSAEKAEESGAESGEVSPDLKETLDSYEAFVDEYVEFMEAYQESGDVTNMLGDYASFMQKYTDFVTKIDNMDTSNMSKADYNYYIEVTARCAEKTAKVAISML